MQLGPIAEWGLNLDKKTVPVNTENFETNKAVSYTHLTLPTILLV